MEPKESEDIYYKNYNNIDQNPFEGFKRLVNSKNEVQKNSYKRNTGLFPTPLKYNINVRTKSKGKKKILVYDKNADKIINEILGEDKIEEPIKEPVKQSAVPKKSFDTSFLREGKNKNTNVSRDKKLKRVLDKPNIIIKRKNIRVNRNDLLSFYYENNNNDNYQVDIYDYSTDNKANKTLFKTICKIINSSGICKNVLKEEDFINGDIQIRDNFPGNENILLLNFNDRRERKPSDCFYADKNVNTRTNFREIRMTIVDVLNGIIIFKGLPLPYDYVLSDIKNNFINLETNNTNFTELNTRTNKVNLTKSQLNDIDDLLEENDSFIINSNNNNTRAYIGLEGKLYGTLKIFGKYVVFDSNKFYTNPDDFTAINRFLYQESYLTNNIGNIVKIKLELDRLANYNYNDPNERAYYESVYKQLINYIIAIERLSFDNINMEESFIDVYHPDSFSSPFVYIFMELKDDYLNGTYNSGIYNNSSEKISSRKYKTIHTLTSQYTVPKEIEEVYFPSGYTREETYLDHIYQNYGDGNRLYFAGKISLQISYKIGELNNYLTYGIFENITKSLKTKIGKTLFEEDILVKLYEASPYILLSPLDYRVKINRINANEEVKDIIINNYDSIGEFSMVNIKQDNRDIAIKLMSNSYYKRKRLANGSKNYFNRFCQLLSYFLKFKDGKQDNERIAELDMFFMLNSEDKIYRTIPELLENYDFDILNITPDFYTTIYNYIIRVENNRGLYNNALMKYIRTLEEKYSDGKTYYQELFGHTTEQLKSEDVLRKIIFYQTTINIILVNYIMCFTNEKLVKVMDIINIFKKSILYFFFNFVNVFVKTGKISEKSDIYNNLKQEYNNNKKANKKIYGFLTVYDYINNKLQKNDVFMKMYVEDDKDTIKIEKIKNDMTSINEGDSRPIYSYVVYYLYEFLSLSDKYDTSSYFYNALIYSKEHLLYTNDNTI